MIPDDQPVSLAQQVHAILENAGWTTVPASDEGRIEVIAYRATLEAIRRQDTPRAFRCIDPGLLPDLIAPETDPAPPSGQHSNRK